MKYLYQNIIKRVTSFSAMLAYLLCMPMVYAFDEPSIIDESSIIIDESSKESDESSTSEITPSIMWVSDDVTSIEDNQSSSFFGKGELWGDNWGVSANIMRGDQNNLFGLPDDSQFINLDVKRRFGSRNKSNFELGLGWQELNIDSILEASGPRVSLGGKLNIFSSFQVYGLTSYFPELADDLENNDGTAYEVEAGVLYSPIPNISLKAGYRHFALDIEENSAIDELGSSSGFLLGTDWSW